jgi:chromate transporter
VVLGAALTGAAGGKYLPAQFAAPGGHGAAAAARREQSGAYLIDDDTPPPPHARFRKSRLALIAFLGALLWLLPMAALMGAQGWDGPLTRMAWFFTKAALLGFGGAYAVLPYVFQGAVEQFHWLTALQMIDGLALGETTPGPLIMVVAFVGFVGGWTRQVLGPDQLFAGAALASTLVTWFTFLPSFLFILAGGPLVEATHGNLKFTAPLTGVTAAVVGVIASLAVFFLVQIAWHPGRGSGFAIDWISLALAAAAAFALFRFKLGVIALIAGCALAGLVLRLAGWA